MDLETLRLGCLKSNCTESLFRLNLGFKLLQNVRFISQYYILEFLVLKETKLCQRYLFLNLNSVFKFFFLISKVKNANK